MSAPVRQKLRWVVALFAACCPSYAAWGQDTPAKLEERVAEQLRIEHNIAVELYNKPIGDVQGAIEKFRKALTSAERELKHRPDLQRAIRRGLEDARQDGGVDEKAWTLKHLTLVIRAMLVDKDESMKIIVKGQSLWERLGGEKKVRKMVEEWVDAMIEDKRVNFTRDGQYPMTPARVTALKESFLKLGSSVTGGPYNYPGPTTKTTHEPMKITAAEFDAAVADLETVLLRNEVPEGDRKFMVGAVEGLRRNFVAGKDGDGSGISIVALLGGEAKLKKIVSDFVDLMVEDKRVNFTRNGTHRITAEKLAEIKSNMYDMASNAFGGERKYDGPKLLEIHKKMGITAAELDAARADLNLALLKNEIQPGAAQVLLRMFDERRASFVVK